MKTAAYLRVSSDKQDTKRQERSIQASGFSVSLWFRDDEGKNPRDKPESRPAFQNMLKAVQAGLIDKIIVDRQDRFGVKDAYQWGKFISLLREHGCELFDASGKNLSADDDVSILTGTLGAITSTREQKEKAHRNITGKIKAAGEGEYQGGYPPYGFDVVCLRDGKEKWRTVYVGHYDRWKVFPDGRRERFTGKDNAPQKDPTDKLFIRPSIEKERVKYAQKIFEWYSSEAITPKQIADRLNDSGVSPIFAKAWHKITITSLLKNPAYIGLPTWNKNPGSRFVEYVGGRIQEVKDKKRRRRAQADFVQPARPLYKPLINMEVWEKVQSKLSNRQARKRRLPDTADLYLKPFLVCGKCGLPMRATRGDTTEYLSESYYCGSYGTYGAKNPSGCRCHRVQHAVLEKIVLDYLKQTAPKVAALLEATETGNMEAAEPLLRSLYNAAMNYHGVACDIMLFVEENTTEGERKLFRKKGKSDSEIYSIIYERIRPKMEAEIAEKEADLDKMLDSFLTLSPALRERANEKMEAIQAEINARKLELIDLGKLWGNLHEELIARKAAISKAAKSLAKDGAGRRKTEALSEVIDKIVCWFRYTDKEGKPTKKKSRLDKVEIVSVSGDTFRVISSPGPC